MFYLRQIEEGDAKIIFEWQSNPITRQYFFDPTIPSYDEHHTWVRDRVTHHFTTTFIIIDEEEASGIVRLDTYDNKNNSYIISILIDPVKYRKGLAEKALMEICEKYKTSELYARVKIKNLPSRQLFKKCGFINVESDLYLKK